MNQYNKHVSNNQEWDYTTKALLSTGLINELSHFQPFDMFTLPPTTCRKINS